jgi:hypothetical protein
MSDLPDSVSSLHPRTHLLNNETSLLSNGHYSPARAPQLHTELQVLVSFLSKHPTVLFSFPIKSHVSFIPWKPQRPPHCAHRSQITMLHFVVSKMEPFAWRFVFIFLFASETLFQENGTHKCRLPSYESLFAVQRTSGSPVLCCNRRNFTHSNKNNQESARMLSVNSKNHAKGVIYLSCILGRWFVSSFQILNLQILRI